MSQIVKVMGILTFFPSITTNIRRPYKPIPDLLFKLESRPVLLVSNDSNGESSVRIDGEQTFESSFSTSMTPLSSLMRINQPSFGVSVKGQSKKGAKGFSFEVGAPVP